MKIHFSSATLQSYENKEKTMDLFYNPIVIFENGELTIEELKSAKWSIEAQPLGVQELEVLSVQVAPIKTLDDNIFVEFKLTKKGVAFSYDNYSCKIRLCVTLEIIQDAVHEELALTHEVLGIVKTKWSKNLI